MMCRLIGYSLEGVIENGYIVFAHVGVSKTTDLREDQIRSRMGLLKSTQTWTRKRYGILPLALSRGPYGLFRRNSLLVR